MYIFIAFVLVIILYIFVFYRYIIGSKNDVNTSFQELDNVFLARWEIIPQFLDYAKINGIAEQNLVNEISDITDKEYENLDQDIKLTLNNDLTDKLNNLILIYENYPVIQKDKDFLNLNRQIAKLNEDILKNMEVYNKNIADFNELIDTFPMNLVAKGFKIQHFNSSEIKSEENKQ